MMTEAASSQALVFCCKSAVTTLKTSKLISVDVFQVNDFVRDKFTDKNGNIPLYGEIVSGACVSYLDFYAI
jgi:hypothetical protein